MSFASPLTLLKSLQIYTEPGKRQMRLKIDMMILLDSKVLFQVFMWQFYPSKAHILGLERLYTDVYTVCVFAHAYMCL